MVQHTRFLSEQVKEEKVMITCICLIWVGLRLSAPTWYYALLGFGLVVNLINLGIKLGESSKKK